jgi:hypothetical protein
MRRDLTSPDDRLIAQLLAPPDLTQGMQSLAYWHDRRQRLAWYRIRRRREAAAMILRWEQRVRGAMLFQAGVPIAVRTSAGLLIARTRLRRWSRRAVVAGAAAVGVTVLAAPIVAFVVLLTQLL